MEAHCQRSHLHPSESLLDHRLLTYRSKLLMEPYAACGADEDATSMALTAMHRLLRRCSVRPAEVGVLHLSPTLLDRSKSMKTELMALTEAEAYADVEGVDHYGASSGAASALLSCVSVIQSEAWDAAGGWRFARMTRSQQSAFLYQAPMLRQFWWGRGRQCKSTKPIDRKSVV